MVVYKKCNNRLQRYIPDDCTFKSFGSQQQEIEQNLFNGTCHPPGLFKAKKADCCCYALRCYFDDDHHSSWHELSLINGTSKL